jgi:glycosyltransferase involved in cell wall biosynthesis
MKVLQIVSKPQRRGAEVFAFELSKELRLRNVELRTVYLYTLGGDQGLPILDCDVCLDGEEDALTEKVPGVQSTLVRGVLAEIRRFGPDIVQANGSRTVKYGAMARLSERQRHRWQLVYRNIDMPTFWNRRLHKVLVYRHIFMRQVAGVVGVSRRSLEQVAQLYHPTAPMVVIYNGIDASKLTSAASRVSVRERFGVKDEEVIVLFVGGLVAQKRPDRFMRVFRDVVDEVSSARAWIVGDGPLRSDAMSLASRLQLEDRCTFFGYRTDVGDLMGAADVLLVTSDTEGIPAAVLEAAFLGLPSIATNVGALDECIEHGKSGMLVDPPFESNLADEVVRLARNREIRAEYGRHARAAARSQFTMDRIADEYLRFYTYVAGRSVR